MTPKDIGNSVHIVGVIDSGRDVGLGHIKRTGSLLDELTFVDKKKDIKYILESGFDSSFFTAKRRFITADFLTGKDLLNKIADINRRRQIDMLIFDSYKIRERTINDILGHCPEAVSLVIDDFNRLRLYRSDFILNYNPLAHRLRYRTAAYTQKLFGMEYFPLSKDIKKIAVKKTGRKKIRDVFVTMGGTDPHNFSEKVCRAFCEGYDDYTFHIVIGPNFAGAGSLVDRYSGKKNYIFYRGLTDLASLMAKCDMAVSSAGISAYELTYLGKPVILVPISKDQILNSEYLKDGFHQLSLDFDAVSEDTVFAGRLRRVFKEAVSGKSFFLSAARRTCRLFGANKPHLSEQLMKRLKHKILRKSNPVKVGSESAVVREYNASLRKKDNYEKARWGSREGMMNRFRLVSRCLRSIKYGNLVDAGCGTGDMFKIIKDRSKKFYGYDLNFNMVAYAKNNSAGHAGYFVASNKAIPVGSGRADVVTLIGVLQNCGVALNDAMKEISRILKRGGHLFLITKNLGWREFVKGKLRPEKEHNWFFDHEISGALTANRLKIVKKSGFVNKSGKLVDMEKSHEIFYWARKI